MAASSPKSGGSDEVKQAGEPAKGGEIAELQAQMAAMQAKLDKLVQKGGG